MSRNRNLYRLQELEQSMQALQQQITDIDDALQNDEKVIAAQQAVDAAQAALPPLQKQSREVEADLDATTTKAAETEERLYSGEIKNPKAMSEMQQEIAGLKSKQETLEETLFGLMESVEQAESTIANTESNHETVVKTQMQKNEALVAERDRKEAEVAELENARAELHDEIGAEGVQLYEKLKPRTRGLPVAKMHNDGTCSKCGVQQNRMTETEVRRGNPAQCDNCKRILIFM
ncbi:MAG: hypothetical protein AAFV33_06865 [Chloroflexota bacterium]